MLRIILPPSYEIQEHLNHWNLQDNQGEVRKAKKGNNNNDYKNNSNKRKEQVDTLAQK